MSLIILDPGIESRIVDLGRPRSRSLGVPVGGAADRRSLSLGNALVGNEPDAAALEVALKGPRLRADADVGCVVFGAPFDLQCEGYRLDVGHTFTLKTGQELRIGTTKPGVRAYLCVCGGFDSPIVLGSRSALAAVRKNDTLPCASSTLRPRYCPELERSFPISNGEAMLSVLPGLQADWFDEATFYCQRYSVMPASNRMGLRLDGPLLTVPDREMTSEPVCPGAIQVTREGQCIVLGIDGQTIGGYPKIAQVIQADLDLLGQLCPGQPIAFRKVSLDEANECFRQQQAALREWSQRLRVSLDA